MANNDSNTRLLLHFDGDEDSTSLLDQAIGASESNVILSNAKQKSDQVKFGARSLYFNGGTTAQVQASSNYNFGTNDFTIDCWIRSSEGHNADSWSWYLDDDNYFTLELLNTVSGSAQFGITYRRNGVNRFSFTSATQALVSVKDVWKHFAFVRSGTSLTLYIDGVVYASMTLATQTETVNVGSWPLNVGAAKWADGPGLSRLNGHMDEFRVHETATWTAPFTVPSLPHAPLMECRASGQYVIIDSFGSNLVGGYSLGSSPFASNLFGKYEILDTFRSDLVGRYPLDIPPYGANLIGIYSMGNGFGSELSGFYKIEDSFGSDLVGEYAILDGPFQSDLSGNYEVLNNTYRADLSGCYQIDGGYRSDLSGMYKVLDQLGANLFGHYDIEDTALKTYLLYYNFGSMPDLDAAPWAEFATLPHTSIAITGEGLHYFVLRRRNKFGLVSQNSTPTIIELDGSNNEIDFRPLMPADVAISPTAGATVRVQGSYCYVEELAAVQADQFLVYIRNDGSNPDPLIDTPVVVPMVKSDGIAKLDWTSSAFGDLDTVKAIVQARRTTGDARDSTSSPIVTTTATTSGPAAVSAKGIQTVKGERRRVP